MQGAEREGRGVEVNAALIKRGAVKAALTKRGAVTAAQIERGAVKGASKEQGEAAVLFVRTASTSPRDRAFFSRSCRRGRGGMDSRRWI